MTDRIADLSERVRALEAEPVSTHPGVLDEVHRGLLGELERLAGIVAGDSRRTGGSGADRS